MGHIREYPAAPGEEFKPELHREFLGRSKQADREGL
jgi:hypothetical protein